MLTSETLPEQELLGLEAAAELLCVSKSTMYRLLDQGKLRGMKAGKQWRFRKEDLLDYLQRGPAALALANLPAGVLDAELVYLADILAQADTPDAFESRTEDEAGKVALLVQRMILLVLAHKASDLHLEPVWEAEGSYSLLRLRVNGVLQEIRRLPIALHLPLVLEWKRLANLSEDTRPQYGIARFIHGRNITLRVATVPTLHGEKLTARTIPWVVPSLDVLGLRETPLVDWALQNAGLLIVTGPTGSGKTTTLVSCLRERQSPEINIMSIGSSMEYSMAGVTYIDAQGMSIAEAVRAARPHDLDILLLGDVNNAELAREVVWTAETGHQVLTTMHARDAISPIFQFVEWGIQRTMFAGALIGITQQRLFFKLCPACKAPVTPDPALLAEVARVSAEGGYVVPDDAVFYGPVGCPQCADYPYGKPGKGYFGRIALHEFFAFTPAMKSAFIRGADLETMTRLSREAGNLSLFAAGMQQAVAGVISLDEVLRRIPEWR